MARDYKHRAQGGKGSPRGPKHIRRKSVGLWRWMLITALVISFVIFLVYLRMTAPKEADTSHGLSTVPATQSKSAEPKNDKAPKVEKKSEPKPHFEFYTILPNKEVVVPEYEIKTRTREERVGKAKESKYIMQAGSFKTAKEAEQLRAKLALMGIQAKVDKAKVGSKTDKAAAGSVTWYRVKIGPYAKMTSVDVIKSRLKKQGIDVMVTEVGD
ncbi:MAG: SPOR domain-containing protein [Methylococcaceae bacterium]